MDKQDKIRYYIISANAYGFYWSKDGWTQKKEDRTIYLTYYGARRQAKKLYQAIIKEL